MKRSYVFQEQENNLLLTCFSKVLKQSVYICEEVELDELDDIFIWFCFILEFFFLIHQIYGLFWVDVGDYGRMELVFMLLDLISSNADFLMIIKANFFCKI